MELTSQHIYGIILAMAIVFGLGVLGGRRVLSSADFSISGRKAGAALVAGTIMGTLIGGGSTVGTAQLAFMYGLSAWWFTLGGGIACLFIALFLARPMRETRFETIPQFLSFGYSPLAGMLAALFVSLGMFINIVPQVFSSIALLMPLAPLSETAAALITVILMILYVIFGGIWGTGLMGSCKVLLTALSLGAGGALAFHLMGGFTGMGESFPRFPWFSLFGRGLNTDLASAFSLLVGVLSSQIYFQAIFSSRSLQAARGGALISAIVGPAIGAGGILIGLYMRVSHPGIVPAQALPLFVMNYFPPLFSGVVFTTLILVCIATGAGLMLGISTMINRDIFQRFAARATDRQVLRMFRWVIVVIAALVFVTVYYSGRDAVILQWSYLSLGLRGATVCFPLLAVLFFKRSILAGAGTAAVALGPLTVIGLSFSPLALNPLYPGLAVSLLVLFAGYWLNKRKINVYTRGMPDS